MHANEAPPSLLQRDRERVYEGKAPSQQTDGPLFCRFTDIPYSDCVGGKSVWGNHRVNVHEGDTTRAFMIQKKKKKTLGASVCLFFSSFL